MKGLCHRSRGLDREDGDANRVTRTRGTSPLAWAPVSRSRLRRPPGAYALGLAVLVGAIGSAGVLVAARDRSGDVVIVPDVAEALEPAPNDAPAENFLLVGSDSRAVIDEGDPNSDVFGDAESMPGRRSDTIMILRRERNGGASLLSLPRDLWVEIPGRDEPNRINSAYNDGAAVLARTITESLGIPIQHYVEIDFEGFQHLVDAIGGVQICVMHAAQDRNSGLELDPGCHILDGEEALAYARSRHYETLVDGEWQSDPSGDLGRIERQQGFIRAAVDRVLGSIEADPFSLNRLLEAVTSSVSIDAGTDPVEAAGALRAAAEQGLRTYMLPVEAFEIDDKSVVELGEGAEEILDYFRGVGPPPVTTPETSVPD